MDDLTAKSGPGNGIFRIADYQDCKSLSSATLPPSDGTSPQKDSFRFPIPQAGTSTSQGELKLAAGAEGLSRVDGRISSNSAVASMGVDPFSPIGNLSAGVGSGMFSSQGGPARDLARTVGAGPRSLAFHSTIDDALTAFRQAVQSGEYPLVSKSEGKHRGVFLVARAEQCAAAYRDLTRSASPTEVRPVRIVYDKRSDEILVQAQKSTR